MSAETEKNQAPKGQDEAGQGGAMLNQTAQTGNPLSNQTSKAGNQLDYEPGQLVKESNKAEGHVGNTGPFGSPESTDT
jgi:hypothetical protein